jgi:hypothetical protein
MKQFVTLITILILATSLCRAEGFELTGKAESYTAKVTFLEGQPVKGSNRVRIDIVDSSSRHVTDAQVGVEYLMPSLPGKPPMMDYHTTAKRAGAAYETTLKIDMTGEWKIVLSITRMKHTEKVTVAFLVK